MFIYLLESPEFQSHPQFIQALFDRSINKTDLSEKVINQSSYQSINETDLSEKVCAPVNITALQSLVRTVIRGVENNGIIVHTRVFENLKKAPQLLVEHGKGPEIIRIF